MELNKIVIASDWMVVRYSCEDCRQFWTQGFSQAYFDEVNPWYIDCCETCGMCVTPDGMEAPPMVQQALQIGFPCEDASTIFASFTHQRTAVWEKSNGKCWFCDRDLNPIHEFNVDALAPLSQRETADPANLVASCNTCNLARAIFYRVE